MRLPEVPTGGQVQLQRVVVDGRCHVADGVVVRADEQTDARRLVRADSGITLVTAVMLA